MNNFPLIDIKKTDYFSFTLSLVIHGIVCWLLCYLPSTDSTPKASVPPYSVTLDLQSFTQGTQHAHDTMPTAKKKIPTTVPKKATAATTTQEKSEEQQPSTPSENQKITSPSDDETPLSTKPVENEMIDESSATHNLDTRGLYTDDDNGDNTKKTNASLELNGWIWDAVPEPIDNTTEVGKLIFMITIDDAGEVIGIKTLETTVSPIVEQCYKNAVANLSFSKTSTELQDTPTSVGKIIFILQYA